MWVFLSRLEFKISPKVDYFWLINGCTGKLIGIISEQNITEVFIFFFIVAGNSDQTEQKSVFVSCVEVEVFIGRLKGRLKFLDKLEYSNSMAPRSLVRTMRQGQSLTGMTNEDMGSWASEI